jgi:hypothetical protein
MTIDHEGYSANGPAFQKVEQRVGAPLDYVAEKLRSAIEGIHATVQSVKENVPDDFPIPAHFPDDFLHRDVFSAKNDLLLSPARSALRFAITSYLALNNMLNLTGVSDLIDQAELLSREELKNRLDHIDSEGSVT